MDFDQAGALPGRTESFQQGQTGGGPVASSLNEDAAVFNSKVPGSYTPHSVLQELPGMSGNGMDAASAARRLPGGYVRPSSNGSSTESYEATSMMQLMGRNLV